MIDETYNMYIYIYMHLSIVIVIRDFQTCTNSDLLATIPVRKPYETIHCQDQKRKLAVRLGLFCGRWPFFEWQTAMINIVSMQMTHSKSVDIGHSLVNEFTRSV